MIYYKLPMVDFMANEAGISGSLLAVVTHSSDADGDGFFRNLFLIVPWLARHAMGINIA